MTEDNSMVDRSSERGRYTIGYMYIPRIHDQQSTRTGGQGTNTVVPLAHYG